MKYHNNDFIFTGKNGYKIKGGSFLITECYITKGQDPDQNIKAGTILPIDSNGKATVRLGRSGSEETAKWFNDRIPAENTTFNHTAGKLNFAFVGTLKLEIQVEASGEILGCTLDGIGIAQGHAGATNNWWFGGKNCKHTDNNYVTTVAASSNGRKVLIGFLRGDNLVNHIDAFPNELSDWMSGIPNDTPINKLIMPGSHDAGMSELHHITVPGFSEEYIKTQALSVEKQLMIGSRYLDIRVDYDHEELVTYHRADNGIGANGQFLRDVFGGIHNFLLDHESEFVIVKISHIRSDRGCQTDIKNKIDSFLKVYKHLFYFNNKSDLMLHTLTLKELRGKILIVQDYDEHIDTINGRFRYRDVISLEKCLNPNLCVYDKYSDTCECEKLETDQLCKWKDQSQYIGSSGMFLLSWTLTAKPPWSMGIEALAKIANSKLPYVLSANIPKLKKPNIVYLDFLNAFNASDIVSYNFLFKEGEVK